MNAMMKAIDWKSLPLPHLESEVRAYYSSFKAPTSLFLSAVLQNNLRVATCYYPIGARPGDFLAFVLWLQKNLPDVCWGSSERYSRWLIFSGNATHIETPFESIMDFVE